MELTIEDIKTIARLNRLEIGWDDLERKGEEARAELVESFRLAKEQIPYFELQFTKFKTDGSNTMEPDEIVDELLACYLLNEVSTKYFSILDLIGS